MNPEQLIKHLISRGIPEDQARQIVASMPGEPSVDANKLSKALGELKDIFAQQSTGGPDADKLQKALTRAETADAARSAVAELGDALLGEVREQNEALCKALLHMGETVIEISAANTDLRAENTEIRKLLTGEDGPFGQILKALNVPLAPRAIRTNPADVEPAPGERTDPNAPQQDTPAALAERMNKAIEIESLAPSTTSARRRELMAAASAMNSGMPLETIAKSYGINPSK